MTKYVCTVCGYIAEGSIPEFCPVCKAPASKFIEKKENTYVTEHVVGIAKDVPEETSSPIPSPKRTIWRVHGWASALRGPR